LGLGVVGAAWGWVLAIIVMPFLAFYFLEKKVFPIFKTKVKAISVDKELFTYSFPLLFAGIAGLVMGWTWTDTLMLGYFTSSTNVGIYNAALPTAQLFEDNSCIVNSRFCCLFVKDKIRNLSVFGMTSAWDREKGTGGIGVTTRKGINLPSGVSY
jgi:hypothetical protein